MKKPIISIGVLGIASIAVKHMVPAILDSKYFSIGAIASRNLDRAQKSAYQYKCKAYGSYELLLKDKSLDAVYIPLPNSLHFKYVKLALEQCKHVLVEKSMGCTLDEVVELNKIAKSNNLILLESFQFRFHSQMKIIKQKLVKDIIGDLRLIRVSFGFPPFNDKNNIRYNKSLGGGALLDAGAYPLKIAPIFLGNNLYVSQASIFIDNDKGVDIWGEGVVQKTNSNLSCQFAFGFDNYYQCRIEFWGSKGKLSTNRIFTSPPGYKPILKIETSKGVETIQLSSDNHFKNILNYFKKLIDKPEKANLEYQQNILQAELIDSFKQKAEMT